MAGIVRADTFRMNTIKSQDSDVTAMNISNTGNVLLPNRPSFMFRFTGANWTTNSSLIGSYSSTLVDQGSPAITWDDATGRLTVPLTGLYFITFGILSNASGGRIEGALFHNRGGTSTQVVNFNGTGSTYDGPTFTIVYPAIANDYFSITEYSGTAYSSSHPQNYFGATFLG